MIEDALKGVPASSWIGLYGQYGWRRQKVVSGKRVLSKV